MKKRVLSFFLAALMVFGACPAIWLPVFAETGSAEAVSYTAEDYQALYTDKELLFEADFASATAADMSEAWQTALTNGTVCSAISTDDRASINADLARFILKNSSDPNATQKTGTFEFAFDRTQKYPFGASFGANGEGNGYLSIPNTQAASGATQAIFVGANTSTTCDLPKIALTTKGAYSIQLGWQLESGAGHSESMLLGGLLGGIKPSGSNLSFALVGRDQIREVNGVYSPTGFLNNPLLQKQADGSIASLPKSVTVPCNTAPMTLTQVAQGYRKTTDRWVDVYFQAQGKNWESVKETDTKVGDADNIAKLEAITMDEIDLDYYYNGTALWSYDDIYFRYYDNVGMFFRNYTGKIYFYRVYAEALTAEDIAQNHFADLARRYQLDIGGYLKLGNAGRRSVWADVASLTFEDDAATVASTYEAAVTRAARQERFESVYLPLYDTQGLTVFLTAAQLRAGDALPETDFYGASDITYDAGTVAGDGCIIGGFTLQGAVSPGVSVLGQIVTLDPDSGALVTQELNAEQLNAGDLSVGGDGISVVAVRIYWSAPTERVAERNAFADICLRYELDMSGWLTLDTAGRQSVQETAFAGETGTSDHQTMLNIAVALYALNGADLDYATPLSEATARYNALPAQVTADNLLDVYRIAEDLRGTATRLSGMIALLHTVLDPLDGVVSDSLTDLRTKQSEVQSAYTTVCGWIEQATALPDSYVGSDLYYAALAPAGAGAEQSAFASLAAALRLDVDSVFALMTEGGADNLSLLSRVYTRMATYTADDGQSTVQHALDRVLYTDALHALYYGWGTDAMLAFLDASGLREGDKLPETDLLGNSLKYSKASAQNGYIVGYVDFNTLFAGNGTDETAFNAGSSTVQAVIYDAGAASGATVLSSPFSAYTSRTDGKIRLDFASWRSDSQQITMYYQPSGVKSYDVGTPVDLSVLATAHRIPITAVPAEDGSYTWQDAEGNVYAAADSAKKVTQKTFTWGDNSYTWSDTMFVNCVDKEYKTGLTLPTCPDGMTTMNYIDGFFTSRVQIGCSGVSKLGGTLPFVYDGTGTYANGTKLNAGSPAGTIRVYSVRAYTEELSDEALALNHMLDLTAQLWDAGYMDTIDIRALLTLDEAGLAAAAAAVKDVALAAVGDATAAESAAQALRDAVLPQTMPVTFLGWQVRLSTSMGCGLRSMYRVNLDLIQHLENNGYTVGIGALMAIADGITQSDLTVTVGQDGTYTADIAKAVVRTAYQTGQTSALFVESTDLYGGVRSFAYTTDFSSVRDPAGAYQTDMLYRACVSLTSPGGAVSLRYCDGVGQTYPDGRVNLYDLAERLTTLYPDDGYEKNANVDRIFQVVWEDRDDTNHTHRFSRTYEADETGHWHPATCKHTDVKGDFAAHSYADGWETDGTTHYRVCTVCGYHGEVAEHCFDGDYIRTETEHYKICSVCGAEGLRGTHTHLAGEDAACADCGSQSVAASLAGLTILDGLSYVRELTVGMQLFRDDTGKTLLTVPPAFENAAMVYNFSDAGSSDYRPQIQVQAYRKGYLYALAPASASENLTAAGFSHVTAYGELSGVYAGQTEPLSVYRISLALGRTVTLDGGAILICSRSGNPADASLVPSNIMTYPDSADIIENALFSYPTFTRGGWGYIDGTHCYSGVPAVAVADYKNYPASGITEGSRVWVAYMSGGTAENKANCILMVTSGDGGETWSDTRVVIDPDNIGPVRTIDPALWTDPNGRVWCFYNQKYKDDDNVTGWGSTDQHDGGVWAIYTDEPWNENAKWSTPIRISDGTCASAPTVLRDGTWLLPVYSTTSGSALHGANLFAFNGYDERWTLWSHVDTFTPSTFVEHSVVENPDGTLRIIMRTTSGIMEVTGTRGADDVSWTSPAMMTDRNTEEVLSNTSSRQCLITLSDDTPMSDALRNYIAANYGTLEPGAIKLFVYHDNTNSNQTGAAANARANMVAAISFDGGMSWDSRLYLHKGGSYSFAVQGSDGRIWITYDYGRTGTQQILVNCVTIDDIWEGEIVTAGSYLNHVATCNRSDQQGWYATPVLEDVSTAGMAQLSSGNGTMKQLAAGEYLYNGSGPVLSALPDCFEGAYYLCYGGASSGATVTAITEGDVYVVAVRKEDRGSNTNTYYDPLWQQESLEEQGFTVINKEETALVAFITGAYNKATLRFVVLKRHMNAGESFTFTGQVAVIGMQ